MFLVQLHNDVSVSFNYKEGTPVLTIHNSFDTAIRIEGVERIDAFRHTMKTLEWAIEHGHIKIEY